MVQKTKQDMEYNKANPRPPSAQKKRPGGPSLKDDNDDEYSDDYEQNDFEDEVDEKEDMKLERLRKAMARENQKASKMAERGMIQQKKKELNLRAGPATGPAMDMESLKNQYIPQEVTNYNPKKPVEDKKNLKEFIQQTQLVMNEVVDHEAANSQEVRADELSELIVLGHDEFFDIFDMMPRTAQDVYNQKLQAGTHKPALVSTRDEDIDKDIQTDDLGLQDKFNQAPDDQMGVDYR